MNSSENECHQTVGRNYDVLKDAATEQQSIKKKKQSNKIDALEDIATKQQPTKKKSSYLTILLAEQNDPLAEQDSLRATQPEDLDSNTK